MGKRKRVQKHLQKMVRQMLAAWVMDEETERLIDEALNPPSKMALKIQKWENDFFADYLSKERFDASLAEFEMTGRLR